MSDPNDISITVLVEDRRNNMSELTLISDEGRKQMSDQNTIEELRAEIARLTEEVEQGPWQRKHTQEWYAQHYGKLQDWARTVLPIEYSDQFFSCIANGIYDAVKDVGKPYKCVGGFMVTPGGYFKMDSAQEQVLFDQCIRAEDAEAEIAALKATLATAATAEQPLLLTCPFTGATSLVHTQAQVDAHERVVVWRVTALTAERDELRGRLVDANEHLQEYYTDMTQVRGELQRVREENARLKAPVSDDDVTEVCKILGRAETNGESFGIVASRILHFLAARSNPPTQKEQP